MPTESEITTYYDDIYRRKGVGAMRTYDIYKETFGYFGPVKKGGTFLDDGTGTGYMLKAAIEAGLDAYGTDISPEAVKVAQHIAPQAKLAVAKGEALPFADKTFDYVACFGSLEHFLDIDKGLDEMIRVAKDDGRFLIIVPNKKYWLWWWQGQYGTKQQAMKETLMDLDGWKDFFQRHGLAITWIGQDMWPRRSLKILKSKNPIRILRRLFVHGLWLFMPLKYTYQFAFVMQKK